MILVVFVNTNEWLSSHLMDDTLMHFICIISTFRFIFRKKEITNDITMMTIIIFSISIIDLSIKCETHFGEFVWQCVVSCKHKVLSHSKDESNENNNSVSFSSISCTVFTIYLLHQQWDTSVSSDKKKSKRFPKSSKSFVLFCVLKHQWTLRVIALHQ